MVTGGISLDSGFWIVASALPVLRSPLTSQSFLTRESSISDKPTTKRDAHYCCAWSAIHDNQKRWTSHYDVRPSSHFTTRHQGGQCTREKTACLVVIAAFTITPSVSLHILCLQDGSTAWAKFGANRCVSFSTTRSASQASQLSSSAKIIAMKFLSCRA